MHRGSNKDHVRKPCTCMMYRAYRPVLHQRIKALKTPYRPIEYNSPLGDKSDLGLPLNPDRCFGYRGWWSSQEQQQQPTNIVPSLDNTESLLKVYSYVSYCYHCSPTTSEFTSICIHTLASRSLYLRANISIIRQAVYYTTMHL